VFKRFSAGFAVGYVLGSKAGEKRYKQIAELGEKVLDVPAISSLHDRAGELFTADNGRQVLQALKDHTALGVLAGSDDSADDEDDSDADGKPATPSPRRHSSKGRSDRSHRVRDMAHSAMERGRID
jgi:hypothetical protein